MAAGQSELLQNLSRRLDVQRFGDTVHVQVPPSWWGRAVVVILLAPVAIAGALVNLVFGLIGGAIALAIWQHHGRERFDLTPSGLRYRSGLSLFRNIDTFEWKSVQRLRVGAIGENIRFEYDRPPYLGTVFSIGHKLTEAEASQLVELIQHYRSATLGISDAVAQVTPRPVFVDEALLSNLGDAVQAKVVGNNITLKISDRNQRLLLVIVVIPLIALLGPLMLALLWALATGRYNPRPKDAIRIVMGYPMLIGAALGALAKFGVQTIVLTPASLNYRAGRGPFRTNRTHAWSTISNIRPAGTAVCFEHAEGRQNLRTVGIASNLVPHTVPAVAQILQQYQAAALQRLDSSTESQP